MKRILVIAIVLLSLIGFTSTSAFADSISTTSNEPINDVLSESEMSPQSLHMTYKIVSTSLYGTGFGEWRHGATGGGPATLTLHNNIVTNRSYTNTLTGDFPIGTGSISAALGVSIGTAEEYGVSYKVDIPDNKVWSIYFRPQVRIYKVTQRLYVNALATETYYDAYAYVFDGWVYEVRK